MDPWAGVAHLLVDGSNLLHRLGREQGRPGATPAVALTGRLRSAVPRGIALTVYLDGPPGPGGVTHVRSGGVEIRHAPRGGADPLILAAVRVSGKPGATLVVTDDRDLARAARRLGARSAGAAWLIERLAPRERRSSPASPAGAGDETDDEDRAAWRPRRGATVKRGNPRRAPRRRGGAAGTERSG